MFVRRHSRGMRAATGRVVNGVLPPDANEFAAFIWIGGIACKRELLGWHIDDSW